MKEYPHVVAGLCRLLRGWHEAEGRAYMYKGVSALEMVTDGDPHDRWLVGDAHDWPAEGSLFILGTFNVSTHVPETQTLTTGQLSAGLVICR